MLRSVRAHRALSFHRVVLLKAGLLCVSLWMSGCHPATQSPPARPVYVLAGSNVSAGFKNNALYIFNAATTAAAIAGDVSTDPLRTALPLSWVRYLNRAPNGSLWIGFGGDFNHNDDRVQVYRPDGTLTHTLHPCTNPEAGITFAAGRVFVACSGDGFAGTVAVLDAVDFSPVAMLPLAQPDAPILLVGSGADEQYVVITAMTVGPEPERSYALAIIADAHKAEVIAQVQLGPDTDVWTILPHAGRFYLLNAASARSAEPLRPDVLVLDPAHPETWETFTLPLAAPLWGQIVTGELYAYHNPGWNTTQQIDWRGLSRTALETGASETWLLEDRFEVGGLAVWDSTPCLVHWNYWQPEATHGLYCLEADGELRQRLAVPDASGVVIP